jgi:hypothetical protein
MRKLLILSIVLVFVVKFETYSQQMLGLVNSTRAGISGAKINPAFIADSRVWFDVNLFTVDIFEENNFLYLPSEHYYVGKLFQKKPNWRDYDGRPFLDYYEKNRQWDIFTQVYMQLPSAMISFGDHSVGLQLNLRQHANLSNVDNHISKFIVEGLGFQPQQNIYFSSEKFQFHQASWFEAGLSYAYVINRFKRNHWSAGITAKKLFGINSFFMHASDMDYVVYNDSTLHIQNMALQFGYSPSSGSGNDIVDFSGGLFNGSGWSFDLGIMYQRKAEGNGFTSFNRLCEQKYDNYIFKAGLSLLDLGWIKYKNNAQIRETPSTEVLWTGLNSYDFNGIGQFAEDLNARAIHPAQQTDDNFTMFLPTAASFQLDFRLYPKWYINTTVLQGLPIGKIRMNMPSILAVTPRYETRLLEVNLPVVLYDYYRPRIGVAVRFMGLTIGTDYINTLFGFRDFTGFDVYLALKIRLERGMCVDGFSEFLKGRRFYQNVCPD